MASAAEDVGRGLMATLGAVALLGFGEACVLCKKPVPLRYALRFATHNVLHSFVWRTVESPLMCHAARLPSIALNEASLLSEGFRALRYLVASYGLVHQLLRLHTPNMPQAPAIRAPFDRVVRLSPGVSRLSGASLQQDDASSIAARVLPLAWNSASREDVQIQMHEWCLQHDAPLRDDLLLLEVDLSEPFTSCAQADVAVDSMRGLVRPFRGPDALARHFDAIVVVLASPWAIPSVLGHPSCDVVVNTSAVVAHTVAGFVHRAQATPAVNVWVDADSAALTQGLLQEDIVAGAVSSESSVETDGVFIVSQAHGGAACVERLLAQGVPPTHIVWVQQEREQIPSAAWVVHVPTLLNEELAVIRAQLRCGMSTALVQDNVRDKYGPLNALQGDAPYRRDRHSVVRVV